jgi:hypothetical protein
MSGSSVPFKTIASGDDLPPEIIPPVEQHSFTLREPGNLFGPVIGKDFFEFDTDSTDISSISFAEDQLIKSTPGVVVSVVDNVVNVRLHEANLVVGFPLVLFPDTQCLRFGQPVSYEIRERSNGYRYQTFVAIADSKNSEYLAEVKALLKEIKKR